MKINIYFGFIQLHRNKSVNRLINQTGNLHTNEDTLQCTNNKNQTQ